MTRFAGATALLLFVCLLPSVDARDPPDSALQTANLAWEKGDYVSALTTYQQLLNGPDADRVLEPIALQTGELYVSTEITTDGSAPAMSPDGKYVGYETGVAPARTIRVVASDGSEKKIADLEGFDGAFSADGSRIAYLKLTPSPALKSAYAELERTPAAERFDRAAALTLQSRTEAQLTVRDLATGTEAALDTGTLAKGAPAFGAGSVVLFAGAAGNGAPQQIYAVSQGKPAVALTSGAGDKTPAGVNSTGDALLFATRGAGPAGGRGAGGGGGRGGSYSLLSIAEQTVTPLNTTDRPSFSGDGKSLSYVAREGDAYQIIVASTSDPTKTAIAHKGPERVEATALSPDGSRVAFQMMPRDDWEIYVANRDGSSEQRLTREIQHDLLPQFLEQRRACWR